MTRSPDRWRLFLEQLHSLSLPLGLRDVDRSAALAAWERSENASVMVLALQHLDDPRRVLARAACACAIAVVRYLPPEHAPLLEALAVCERWAAGEPHPGSEEAARLMAVAAAADGPPGPTGLALMSVKAAVGLLDLDDPAPSLAACDGAAECAADALLDAGEVDSGEMARAHLAPLVRAAVGPLPP